ARARDGARGPPRGAGPPDRRRRRARGPRQRGAQRLRDGRPMSAGVWAFRAVDALGAPVRGELSGPSQEAVTGQPRQQALAVLSGMVMCVVPVFAKVFQENGSQLPGLTRFTLGVSDVVRHYPYVLFGVAFGVVFGFLKWKSSERGRQQWDRLRLRTPLKIGE